MTVAAKFCRTAGHLSTDTVSSIEARRPNLPARHAMLILNPLTLQGFPRIPALYYIERSKLNFELHLGNACTFVISLVMRNMSSGTIPVYAKEVAQHMMHVSYMPRCTSAVSSTFVQHRHLDRYLSDGTDVRYRYKNWNPYQVNASDVPLIRCTVPGYPLLAQRRHTF